TNITQALAVNTPLSVSSTIVGQVFDFTLRGADELVWRVESRRVLFRCYSAVSWSIVKPDGTNLTSTGLCANVGAFNNQTLPTTEIGRASCRERAKNGGATVTLKQNRTKDLADNTPLSVSSTHAGQGLAA